LKTSTDPDTYDGGADPNGAGAGEKLPVGKVPSLNILMSLKFAWVGIHVDTGAEVPMKVALDGVNLGGVGSVSTDCKFPSTKIYIIELTNEIATWVHVSIAT
jgi:hypothetical protein